MGRVSTTIFETMISIAYAFYMTAEEPKKKNPIGSTGKTVAVNVKRLREDQRLAFTDLAAILDKIGKPIPTLGLRHIEADKRRVDSDDLVALSVALGVSPVTLLMPWTADPDDLVDITGYDHPVPAYTLWRWLIGAMPVEHEASDEALMARFFQRKARPGWVKPEGAGMLKTTQQQIAELQQQVAALQRRQEEHERQMAAELDEELRARGVEVPDGHN